MSKTVIVSSHILPELADVCTRVGMIEKGKLMVLYEYFRELVANREVMG